MSAGSPLVFRPSFAQRAMAMLLFAGSWLVGVRALAQIMERADIVQLLQQGEDGFGGGLEDF